MYDVDIDAETVSVSYGFARHLPHRAFVNSRLQMDCGFHECEE